MRGDVDGNAKFFASLTPKGWKWIGRKAFLRGAHGTFELSLHGGSSSTESGLKGTFTSDEGAQSSIVFEFDDFLVGTNPKNNPNWKERDGVHGWWHDNGASIDWYIGVPKSLRPLHHAIDEWCAIWNMRGGVQ